jgi:hypothetical protein
MYLGRFEDCCAYSLSTATADRSDYDHRSLHSLLLLSVDESSSLVHIILPAASLTNCYHVEWIHLHTRRTDPSYRLEWYLLLNARAKHRPCVYYGGRVYFSGCSSGSLSPDRGKSECLSTKKEC